MVAEILKMLDILYDVPHLILHRCIKYETKRSSHFLILKLYIVRVN